MAAGVGNELLLNPQRRAIRRLLLAAPAVELCGEGPQLIPRLRQGLLRLGIRGRNGGELLAEPQCLAQGGLRLAEPVRLLEQDAESVIGARPLGADGRGVAEECDRLAVGLLRPGKITEQLFDVPQPAVAPPRLGTDGGVGFRLIEEVEVEPLRLGQEPLAHRLDLGNIGQLDLADLGQHLRRRRPGRDGSSPRRGRARGRRSPFASRPHGRWRPPRHARGRSGRYRSPGR